MHESVSSKYFIRNFARANQNANLNTPLIRCNFRIWSLHKLAGYDNQITDFTMYESKAKRSTLYAQSAMSFCAFIIHIFFDFRDALVETNCHILTRTIHVALSIVLTVVSRAVQLCISQKTSRFDPTH